MTPKDFKNTRENMRYSQHGLSQEWGMGENGGRTIRRWESGDRPMNPIAAYCIKLMHMKLHGYDISDKTGAKK